MRFNGLYLISNEDRTWFKLYLKEPRVCLATGHCLDAIKGSVIKLVLKYKTELKLRQALDNMTESIQVSNTQMKAIEQEYNKSPNWEEELYLAIKEGLHLVKKDNPVLKNKAKFKRSEGNFKIENPQIQSTSRVSATRVKNVKPINKLKLLRNR